MNNHILTGKEFILLALRNGFESYQQIADVFNEGKVDLVKKWATGTRQPALITQVGLYAIAKQEGWV